ncbi:MAG: DUF3052 family protein [Chloroflexi bacterium]|nr:DUF3052 family protein [Chloroflexota bacterium]
MAERDYSHRAVADKLGIKAGHAVAFARRAGEWEPLLLQQLLERAGRPPAAAGEPVDVVIKAVEAGTDAAAVLERWKPRLRPNGGIWLLTPKRGRPGYVDQRDLIAAGLAAGLVDNKSCSVSDTTSAIRFVIRRKDRPSEPRA